MAQPKSFMLLSDYLHTPNTDIHLGTILLLSDETKLPDPDIPLNPNSRPPVLPSSIKRSLEEPWTFQNGKTRNISGGLDAEVPIFTPAGGGFVLGCSKNQQLSITCERVETTRFVPTTAYLAQALSIEDVQQYCRQHYFPSVYMVTGIKTAFNATLTNTLARSSSGGVHLSVDASGAGVPLKVGPSGHVGSNEENSEERSIAGPFILAYQLKRLKLRRDATVKKMEGYTKHALFDDTVQAPENVVSADDIDELWEVEDVDADTEHDV